MIVYSMQALPKGALLNPQFTGAEKKYLRACKAELEARLRFNISQIESLQTRQGNDAAISPFADANARIMIQIAQINQNL